ncbi:MliC family protein [Hoyosella subflava]|uniref:MliC family protein n=1 Tax=Hoyosella subflava TaxID=639313 RepID=UPI00059E2B8A|nr:MliC family protein [Hoyosella subflava]
MKRLIVLMVGLLATGCATTPPDSDPNDTAPTSPPAAAETTVAAAPTFDCSAPSSEIESLVCTDTDMADLDSRLNSEYQQVLNTPGADKDALEASQIDWQSQREECTQEADPKVCVQQAYLTRLVELHIADPTTAAPTEARYNCPDGEELTARYYNDGDPQAGVFTWEGNEVILFIEMSGSGARYGRDGVSFWEHQGEATFDYYGDSVVCEVA